jgi:hypothetical protein
MPGASTELAATESFPGRDRLRAWRPWPTCMEKTASGGKTTNFTGIYITGFHGDINGIYIYMYIYTYTYTNNMHDILGLPENGGCHYEQKDRR